MPGTADGKKNKSGVRKMKIAVVTVYDGLNYGSFLQAYAMQAFLKECGHEVYFVQRLTEEENLALFTTRRPQEDCGVVRRLWRKILSCTVNREKIQRQTRYYKSQFPYYQEAWKHFRLISPEEAGGMDCIVCGSDEIWNLNNLNLDVPFYACAGYGDEIPKLAVAVSAGNASRDDFRKYPQLEKAIGEFAKFLVRDRHTEELVREITGRKAEMVCDPTLLLDRRLFRKSEGHLNLPERYLLLYTYGLTESQGRLLRDFAQRHHCQIVSACMDTGIADETILASPLDFAQLAARAEYCVTTTFHGTIFSLLFAKRFCSVAKYPKIAALITQVQEEGHLWDGESEEELTRILETETDRAELDERLELLRVESAAKIKKALEKIEHIG